MTSIPASTASPSSPAAASTAGTGATGLSAVTRTLLAPATAVVIVAVSLLLLMTPIWMHFALPASSGTGALEPGLAYQLSDRTIAELFMGPGTFADFAADEAGHMRDVRLVLLGFLALTAVSLAFVLWSIRRSSHNPGTWRAIARGGSGLVAGLILVGAIAAVAFASAFELFHRILFPGGNWEFPADSLLIRLYPYAFWQLSAAALGVLAVTGGLLVWALARRRARALENRSPD